MKPIYIYSTGWCILAIATLISGNHNTSDTLICCSTATILAFIGELS